jgi:hypothetical protein
MKRNDASPTVFVFYIYMLLIVNPKVHYQ